MILKRLFQRPKSPERRCYEAIVAAARHPVFYAAWGVPDSLDGRFDMIVMHCYLLLDRLKGVEEGFRQNLVDELFRDMDRSLREMGVGDVVVGKRVRKMAEAFYGRLTAYDKAMAGGEGTLAEAVSRNVFPDGNAGVGPERLTGYMLSQRINLAAQQARAIAGGNVSFKEPTP